MEIDAPVTGYSSAAPLGSDARSEHALIVDASRDREATEGLDQVWLTIVWSGVEQLGYSVHSVWTSEQEARARADQMEFGDVLPVPRMEGQMGEKGYFQRFRLSRR